MAGFLDLLSNERFLNQVSAGIQVAAGAQVTMGYLANGANALAQSRFVADQLREQAGDAMATAQRKAWSDDRQTQYLASETIARAAASGGGASDPTVVNIIAAQAAEGAYRKSVDLYEGDSRARLLNLQADAKEYEGQAHAASDRRMAGVSMLGTAATLLDKGYEKDQAIVKGRSAMPVGNTMLSSYSRDSSILSRFGGDGPKVPGDLAGWGGY